MKLILASASPRRQALLRGLGLDFTIQCAGIDEHMDEACGAEAEVARISREKAAAVFAQAEKDAVVIAADTIVCVDGRILGKPKHKEAAAAMLRTLSGRSHQVRTGVTVCSASQMVTEVDTTEVCFRPLSEAEIAAYVATGEPMDKAGAYGVQGKGMRNIQKIHGDFYTVMGLPGGKLWRFLHGQSL